MADADLRPRLGPGLVAVHRPERLEVIGGARTQVFTGRFATETLPRLLTLLDGARTVDGIAAELDVAPDDLVPVVDLLVARGVVTRSAPPASAMGAFLTRSLGADRALAAADRLARSAVAILGAGPHAGRLADLLHRSGVGGTGTARADLAVCFDDAPLPPGPVLLVRLTDSAVAVGPLCRTPGGRCPDCLPPAAAAPGTPDGATLATGLALIAGTVLRYLGQFGAPEELHGITTVTGHGLGRQVTEVARQANCRTCGQREPVPPVAEFARAQVGEQPPWGSQAEPLEPDPDVGLGLGKRYLAARVLHPRDHRPAESFVRRLGWLLSRTTGTRYAGDVRDTQLATRWAPSVANLGATHAYVAGDLDGTGPELYYFEPDRGVLVSLRRIAADTFPAGVPGAATVVLTGDASAAKLRFGAAADHVLLVDSGFALGQLLGLAGAAGLRFDDLGGAPAGFADVLGIDPARETLVAAVAVAPDPDGARIRTPRLLPAGYRFDDRAVPAAALRRLLSTADELTRSGGVACGVYARRVAGLTPGFHELPGTPHRSEPVEEFLAERGLDVPVLLLFHCDPADVLARFGPSGHVDALVTAASAANRVRLAAARHRLAGGLFARLPESLLAATSADWTLPRRVLAGLALGYPVRQAGRAVGVVW